MLRSLVVPVLVPLAPLPEPALAPVPELPLVLPLPVVLQAAAASAMMLPSTAFCKLEFIASSQG
jgi:hypothetical protein